MHLIISRLKFRVSEDSYYVESQDTDEATAHKKLKALELLNTENDKILVLGGVYSSNDAQDIHVLSNEGNYLYSVKLPYRTPSIVYKKGYLYSSTNLGSKVIKWKVDF